VKTWKSIRFALKEEAVGIPTIQNQEDPRNKCKGIHLKSKLKGFTKK
jgi:hypothetical protein